MQESTANDAIKIAEGQTIITVNIITIIIDSV